MAKGAMFHRYATNAKRASEKKMFDGEKARKRLEKNDPHWKDSKDVENIQKQHRKMKDALKGFKPVFHASNGGG